MFLEQNRRICFPLGPQPIWSEVLDLRQHWAQIASHEVNPKSSQISFGCSHELCATTVLVHSKGRSPLQMEGFAPGLVFTFLLQEWESTFHSHEHQSVLSRQALACHLCVQGVMQMLPSAKGSTSICREQSIALPIVWVIWRFSMGLFGQQFNQMEHISIPRALFGNQRFPAGPPSPF